MNNLSQEKIDIIKNYVVETLIEEYAYDKMIAKEMVNNSKFPTLLESNPDYVLHYDFYYWAEYVNDDRLFCV